MPALPSLRDAAADLLLGSVCVGCAAPGRLLCPRCRASLESTPGIYWPRPTPAGLAEPWACGEYAGVLRDLVLAHKERGQWRLGRPLGELLAASVQAATAGLAGPVVLVPVPSRASAVRDRGFDVTSHLVGRAVRILSRAGHPVHRGRLLRLAARVSDQAGLGADERSANLAGSMSCRGRAMQRLADRVPEAHVVVCDDVLTTGSTAREAQRALAESGVAVRAVAVIAATRLRIPPESKVRLSSRRVTD